MCGKGFARTLCGHGHIFANIAEALCDNGRSVALPFDDARSHGRQLANHPSSGACATIPHLRTAALDVLTATPLGKTQRLCRLMPDTIRSVVRGDHNMLAANAAGAMVCIPFRISSFGMRRGVWPRIINRFPGCKTFGWMKDTHKGSMKGGARPRRYACMSSKNRLDKRDVRSSRSDGWENARWRERDAIGWRARNTPAPQNQATPCFIPVRVQCSCIGFIRGVRF